MNALLSLTLKGSAIGALMLAVTAVGCSSDSDDKDGTGGKGGTSAGGSKSDAGEPSTDKGGDKGTTPGEGGNGAGGSTSSGGDDAGKGGEDTGIGGEHLTGGGGEPASGGAPAIGEGGSPSVGTGPAEGKFCNTLSFGDGTNDEDTTFVLEVGTGADKVTFTAKTGECAPADGLACQVLPEGDAVQIVLRDASDLDTAIETSEAEILAGEDWVFWNAVEDGTLVTKGFPIDQSEAECKDVTYD